MSLDYATRRKPGPKHGHRQRRTNVFAPATLHHPLSERGQAAMLAASGTRPLLPDGKTPRTCGWCGGRESTGWAWDEDRGALVAICDRCVVGHKQRNCI